MTAYLRVLLLTAIVAPSTYAADEATLRAEVTRKYAAQADVILRGTVVRPSAATLPVSDARSLAIVRLDELVSGPAALKSFVGKDVTVQLREPVKARQGQQRVFFTRMWQLGEDVGLVELGSYASPMTADAGNAAATDVQRIKMDAVNNQLKARIAKADLVVAAQVLSVKQAPVRRIISEHDPLWTEAQVQVEEVLKGSAARTMTVLFPASTDVMWFRVPKLKEGDRGVLVLNSSLPSAPSTSQVGIVAVEDFLPPTEVARVKNLLPR